MIESTGCETMFFTASIGCAIERFKPSANKSPLLVSTKVRIAATSPMRFSACGTPTASIVPKSESIVKCAMNPSVTTWSRTR